MANKQQIKTRIALKVDELSNWGGSTLPLMAGEVAFARLSGDYAGKYEMRIGVGDKTWSQLSSSNLIIDASQVKGLEEAMAALSTSFYQESTFEALPSADVTHGSIGVVLEKTTVPDATVEALGEAGAEKEVEYRTAYWFDTGLTSDACPNGTWRQLDGNYKAENVYFTTDMKLTEQFGKHKPVATGYTLSCKNMSLVDVIKEAYSEVKKPNPQAPTASWTRSTADIGEKEIGDWSIGLPSLTFKYIADGKWDNYNSGRTAGCTVPLSSVVIKREAKQAEDFNGNVFNLSAVNAVVSSDASTNVAINGTVVLDAESASEVSVQYTASQQTLATYSGTAKYTDGTTIPLDNLGGECPDKKVSGGDFTSHSTNVTVPAGKYPYFMFYTLDEGCPNALNTSNATKISKDGVNTTTASGSSVKATQLAVAGTLYKTFEQIPDNILIGGTDKSGSYKNLYVVLPTGTKNDWDGKMSNGVDGVAIQTIHKKDVTVTLLNGETKAYTAFMVENAAVVNDYLCQMSWS